MTDLHFRPGAHVEVGCTNAGPGWCIVSISELPHRDRCWLRSFPTHEEAVQDLERRGLLTTETATRLRQGEPTTEGQGISVVSNLWNKLAIAGYGFLPAQRMQ